MKKIVLYTLVCSTWLGFSQETTVNDALRFGLNDLNGSARFRGLSGSMGAIGGDLSAININPAGSVVFKFNTFSATASGFNKMNEARYFGTKTSENDFKLDINQIGAIFVFENTASSNGWKKLSLGINYENTNNFNEQSHIRGINPKNSVGDYFFNYAQGYKLDLLQTQSGESISSLYQYLGETPGLGFGAQQAMLGYQGYIVGAVNEDNQDNIDYYTNIPSGGNFYQDNFSQTRGYNGKLTGNFATNYNDILSLGLNLNVHFTDITKTSNLYESNTNAPYIDGTTVKEIRFTNELYTYGRGFSFNLGAIANVTKQLKLGFAYESPTWYELNEELSQRLIVKSTDANKSYTDIIDPNVLNVYPSYTVQIPNKVTGSMAYIFGSKGFINIDVSSRNYANTKFKPKNVDPYYSLNNYMNANLQRAISLNVGGEYKLKQISLRGGYRFEESPFKNEHNRGDLHGYSAGLGYSFYTSRIDLSYANTRVNYKQSLITSGMNDQSQITNINDTVSLSYTITF
ncbi:MAG TPA: transporter [Flavobacterium sp.]|nr:transporter [Flavobacterium sp.]